MTDLWRYQGTYYFNDTKNIKPVSEKIKEILEGKRYVFVSCYEFMRYEPEIRFNQRMDNISTWKNDGDDDRYGGFHVNDTYGVWGCTFINKELTNEIGSISLFDNGIQVHEKNGFGQWFWWKIIVQEDGRE